MKFKSRFYMFCYLLFYTFNVILISIFQVHHVIDFTTLSGLVHKDWNDECIMTIREFFENPRIPCLTLFFRNDILTAQLSFPKEPVDELSYFVRKAYEIFSPEDFPSKVLFGTINDNVEVSILMIVNNVLSPIFTKIKTWPDSILYNKFQKDIRIHFIEIYPVF